MGRLFYKIILLFIICTSFIIIPNTNNESIDNDPWSTTDWNIECFEIDNSANGDYYYAGEPCTYTKRDDESTYIIDDIQKNRIKQALKSASNYLSNDGYSEPHIGKENENWNAIVYPPHCYCTNQVFVDCCQSVDNQGNSKFNDESLFGFHREDELMIKSTEDMVSMQLSTSVHELFHGVAYNYLNSNGHLNNFRSDEFNWIREGGAEGFAWTWARSNGVNPVEFNADAGIRPYDLPLFTGDKGAPDTFAYNTAYFWEFISRMDGNYKFMQSILKKDYGRNEGSTSGGVWQVHEGLLDEGFETGLVGVYKDFVRIALRNEKYFTKIHKKDITALKQDFILNTEAIPPIATYPGKFIIRPNEIEVEERETKKFMLKIWKGASFDVSSHLFVNGQEVEDSIKINVTEDFRNLDSIPVHIRLANIDEIPHESRFSANQEIYAKLVEIECPLLPKDIKRLVYESENDGEKQLRITYNLAWESIEDGDEKIDSMSLSIYSYQLNKVLGTAALELECRDEGLVFQGMETAVMAPPEFASSQLEMNVVTNTNLIPHMPEVGSTLPNASVEVNSTTTNDNAMIGVVEMDISSELTNRKVIARETITVPAGTFDCWRIEYDAKANIRLDGTRRMVLKLIERQLRGAGDASCTLWVTKNYGWVKQEVNSSSGISTYELVSVTRN